MGQHASSSSSPPLNQTEAIDRKPKPTCQRHNIFPRSFKRLLARHRRHKGKHAKTETKSFDGEGNENLSSNANNVIFSAVPDSISRLFIAFPSSSSSKKISKHSFVSLALSKLACFAQMSKEKMVENKGMTMTKLIQKLSFHKTTKKKKKAKPASSSLSSQTDSKPDGNNNKAKKGVDLLELSRYDSKLREQLLRKLLSPSKNAPQAPEEIYKRNLKRFERILTITTNTSDEDTETDSLSEVEDASKSSAGGYSKMGVSKGLPRIITTSKNRVEVDVHFMDWIKSRVSSKSKQDQNGNPTTTASSGTMANKTTSFSKKPSTSKFGTGKTSLARSGKSSSNRTRKKTKSSWSKSSASKPYYSIGVGQTLVQSDSDSDESSEEEEDSPADENNNKISDKGQHEKNRSSRTQVMDMEPRRFYRESRNSSDPMFIKKGCCAGKGHRIGGAGGAPPVYLDYGGGIAGGSSVGARKRAHQDPVMERLKNVDVVEELTYMVPNPCGCGEESDEDDCEYYAVCDSCGEMEPLPEELKKQFTKKGKKEDTTPVTYSRRQRFNFKQNNGEGDEDGPPFRYGGGQGPSCRCNCCVAGLRRNQNCQCKCCQMMGTLRRCNSFDETPVGKNPQIRLIPYPEEIRKKKIEECMKVVPETSGMYKFEKKDKEFELQVPRTPTPIILEVPVPRRLAKNELQNIVRGMANKKFGVQCPPTPVEAEPLFLPPIYGQCNPCCNPCCAPGTNQQQNPGTATTTNTGYTSGGYTYSGATQNSSYPSPSKVTDGKETSLDTAIKGVVVKNNALQRKGSSSTSLPSS